MVIWSFYLFVVVVLSSIIFLQKGEDAVSVNQPSKFMTPRAMSNFLSKSTYFLYFLFIGLSMVIGIVIKKEKESLKRVLSKQETEQISEDFSTKDEKIEIDNQTGNDK